MMIVLLYVGLSETLVRERDRLMIDNMHPFGSQSNVLSPYWDYHNRLNDMNSWWNKFLIIDAINKLGWEGTHVIRLTRTIYAPISKVAVEIDKEVVEHLSNLDRSHKLDWKFRCLDSAIEALKRKTGEL